MTKKITGTSHEDQYKILTTSRSILLRIRIMSFVVEKIKTHNSCEKNVGKILYIRAGHRDNTVRVLCVMDT
jgi:hypothetical protein